MTSPSMGKQVFSGQRVAMTLHRRTIKDGCGCVDEHEVRLLPERRSPRLPGRVWAVLAGSVLAGLALNLAGVVYTYHAWGTDAQLAGPVTGAFLSWVRVSSFLVLLTLLGWAVAWRGRRVLFAAPALSFTFVPMVADLLRGSGHLMPSLIGGFQVLAHDYGEWVFWAEAAIKLTLVLIPGFVVARQVEPVRRNPFRLLAAALMAVPASLVVYYVVVYLSANGRLEGGVAASYVAAFCVGAAMGFDRPVWPWLIVVLPALASSWVQPLFQLDGSAYLVLILIALLGALTVPLSRRYRQVLTDPDSGRPLSSATG